MTFLARLLLAACGSCALAPAAAAQEQGPWFFCYVDPPTFNSGSYVYTTVNYIGSGPLPQAEVAAAIAAEEPRVGARPISCWRYATQAEAEQRRQQGMAYDRGRNYGVKVIGWRSALAPPPPAAEPVAAPPPQPAVSAVAPPAPAPVPSPVPAPSRMDPLLPAPAGAAASEPVRTPTRRMTKQEADEKYAREMAEHQKRLADHARQQAAHAAAVQAELARARESTARAQQEQARFEEERRRHAEQRQAYERQKAQWEADVAACRGGDTSRCAKYPPTAPPSTPN